MIGAGTTAWSAPATWPGPGWTWSCWRRPHPRRLHPHRGAARRPGRLEVGAYEHGGLRGSGVADDPGAGGALRAPLPPPRPDHPGPLRRRDGPGLRRLPGADRRAPGPGGRRRRRRRLPALRRLGQGRGRPARPDRGRPAAVPARAGRPGRGRPRPQAGRFLQALLGSASNLVRLSPTSASRPRWPTGRPTQQSPADPGTGAGFPPGRRARPAGRRPAGGSQATVDALVRCLEAAGGCCAAGCR